MTPLVPGEVHLIVLVLTTQNRLTGIESPANMRFGGVPH